MSLLDFNALLPNEAFQQLSKDFRRARLNRNHSRQKAAELSGVPSSTIRKFESTSKISLLQFVLLCGVYGDISRFTGIFNMVPHSIEEIEKPAPRQRGRG